MFLYIFAILIGGIILSLFAIFKYIAGGPVDYWEKRGVPYIKSADTGAVREKLKLPFHEIDLRSYAIIKAKAKAKESSTTPILYGGMIELRQPMAVVIDPELIKHILVKDFDHFVNRRGINTRGKDPMFDTMLFNMEGQPWKEMRATMSPTFSTGKIKRMFDIFDSSGQKFVEYLKRKVKHSTELDMRDSCSKLTLDVIASSAFGVDSGNFGDVETPFSLMSGRFNSSNTLGLAQIIKFVLLMSLPKFLIKYLGFSFFDAVSMNFFADVVRKTILARESLGGEKREDFLQLMLDAKSGKLDQDDEGQGQGQEEKKAKLTEDLILAQCVLFFIAGFDTTESLLIFAAYELAINPEVQEKLYEEVNDTLENNDGKLTYDLVNKMPYLEMVISETLRKYPPAVRLDRRVVTSSYKVPGTEVTWDKDTIAVIPVYAIHHDESIYPNPDKFIPERFSPEQKAGRHPYTYLPFGLGPRSCIAMRFALVEAKTAIAHLIHSFQLEPSAKTPIPVTFSRGTTLKPAAGMWLNVKSRD